MSDYSYYGKYVRVRDAAWKIHLDLTLSSLPVRATNIARQMQITTIENSMIDLLKPTEYGRSYYVDNNWQIVYDDDLPDNMAKAIVLHEVSHILMGHEMIKEGSIQMFSHKPEEEREADMFMIRILTPACILWGLDLHTAEDIAKWCEIPMKLARQRAERMKELYKRDKFLTKPLEQKVFTQYLPFLKEYGNPHRIEECCKRIPN